MTVVVVGAEPSSLLNFRGDLLQAMVAKGRRVIAASAPATTEQKASLKSLGVEHHAIPISRTSLNPVDDLKTATALHRLFRKERPQFVLAYTIKPVIWSGIALRGIPGTRFFALITGLGYGFEGERLGRRMLTGVVEKLYRTALGQAEAVIFQNADNRDVFIDRGIAPAARCHVVNGSGVHLSRFEVAPLPESGTIFLTIARLLGDKGLREYAAAAAKAKSRFTDVECHLVGPLDPSPDGIRLEEIKSWQNSGAIIYHGAASDVRPFLKQCHVYVLPSYHEGMPRTVLEAMAMGRPVLTTDVPGCRETVITGVNGFLVPKADVDSLTDRMIWFIQNRASWPAMAAASRKLAEERFDVNAINADMLRIMGIGHSPNTG